MCENNKDTNIKELYNDLTLNEIANIFDIFLKCPDNCSCDGCTLNNYSLNNKKIGCFKLRDVAMQKIVDIISHPRG